MTPSFPYGVDGSDVFLLAGHLLQAYESSLKGGPDLERLFEFCFHDLDERLLRILDFAEEKALGGSRGGDSSWPWGSIDSTKNRETLPTLIAQLIERDSGHKAAARERSLRLIGMPHPTLRDIAENKEVRKLFLVGFSSAGIINHMGVRHAMKDELDLAVRYMSAAILVCPAHTESLINRGKANLLIGRQELGLQDYEAASFFGGEDSEVDEILKQHKRGRWRP
jgi:hypothetical protein